MKKVIICLTTLCISGLVSASADDSARIALYFLYGSKPKSQYRDVENKWFGGLHGGHVSIGQGSRVTGFEPDGPCHIFPRRKNKHCAFVNEELSQWADDTSSLKYAIIIIPLSQAQYDSLEVLHKRYLADPPFDYAFFGMRCAAASYELLSAIGITRPKSRWWNVCSHFYPKPMRKKMFRIAKERGYTVICQPGRSTRIWEKDRFLSE